MTDPFGFTLLILAAAYLLRDQISASSRSAAETAQEARREAQEVSTRLRREVEGLRRRQALDVLYSAKRQYVAKADNFYALKKEYGDRLHKLHQDVRQLKAMRQGSYESGRHSEIPQLKTKINELYDVIGQVDDSFRHYGRQVQEFNAATSEIKRLIDQYKT